MKKIPLALFTALIFSQASALELKSDAQKLGYTMGHEMGTVLKETEDKRIDLEAAQAGVQDALEGKNQLGAEETSKLLETFTEEQAKLWRRRPRRRPPRPRRARPRKRTRTRPRPKRPRLKKPRPPKPKPKKPRIKSIFEN